MPQKGELLNWVPLWLTETKYCGGSFEKLCRLFLKIVYGVGRPGCVHTVWVAFHGCGEIPRQSIREVKYILKLSFAL